MDLCTKVNVLPTYAALSLLHLRQVLPSYPTSNKGASIGAAGAVNLSPKHPECWAHSGAYVGSDWQPRGPIQFNDYPLDCFNDRRSSGSTNGHLNCTHTWCEHMVHVVSHSKHFDYHALICLTIHDHRKRFVGYQDG